MLNYFVRSMNKSCLNDIDTITNRVIFKRLKPNIKKFNLNKKKIFIYFQHHNILFLI